jgi:putative endonuclease
LAVLRALFAFAILLADMPTPTWLTKLLKPLKPLMREVPTSANGKGVLGDRGENVAARYVRSTLGYKILIRNYKNVDIVARDGNMIVFIEVKTRAYDDPTPEDQVNHVKQHQITKAARIFLSRYGTPRPPARFDVIAIVWPTGRDPMIRHTPHAFEATF